MDDLNVIRLMAMDNIAKGRIARARMEVKENLGEGGGGAAGGLSDPSTGFSLVQESSSWKNHLSSGKNPHTGKVAFHVCWLIVRRKLCLRKEDWSR